MRTWPMEAYPGSRSADAIFWGCALEAIPPFQGGDGALGPPRLPRSAEVTAPATFPCFDLIRI
jgi:hypothetical protein